MNFLFRAFAAASLALVTGVSVMGCDACRDFKADPTKYDFYNAKDEKGAQKEAGKLVLAVYAVGTPRDLVREAIETALKNAGGGSVGDVKDEAGNYRNFGRWVPYGGENTSVAFETTFGAKDLNTSEPLELVWRGTANERVLEINHMDQGKLTAGYPSLAEKNGKFVLKCPNTYAADNKRTLIAVTKLEERPTGGYKFKGQLPFAIRSKASKTTEIHPEWDGAADKVTPDLESIEFFEVSGFKGDSRELQCQLMRKEVTTQNGSLLTFDLALANMWFKVTGHSEVAFKVFEAGGIVTGESGQVGNVEAKLPDGFPSPGKKYESKDALDKVTEKDAQPGDYFIKADSDEQTNTITYRLFIRIPVKKDSKDPEEVSFKIPVKKADGSTKELNTKWTASSK